jgi:hypothetical protein
MKKMKREKKDDAKYLAIPAFLLMGLGVGLLLDQTAAFTLIGLGAGFFFAYVTTFIK